MKSQFKINETELNIVTGGKAKNVTKEILTVVHQYGPDIVDDAKKAFIFVMGGWTKLIPIKKPTNPVYRPNTINPKFL